MRAPASLETMSASVPDGIWIDVPYDPASFGAKAPMQWRVGEKSVVTYAYVVEHRTMTLTFKIEHSTLAGTPSNELFLRIPGGYLPNAGSANPIWICSRSGKECGYATVHRGLDVVVLYRATEEWFPIEPGEFFVFGQLMFEMQ